MSLTLAQNSAHGTVTTKVFNLVYTFSILLKRVLRRFQETSTVMVSVVSIYAVDGHDI